MNLNQLAGNVQLDCSAGAEQAGLFSVRFSDAEALARTLLLLRSFQAQELSEQVCDDVRDMAFGSRRRTLQDLLAEHSA